MVKRLAALASYVLVLTLEGLAQTAPKIHELIASPQTVHRNSFDATLKPVLQIEAGDIVRLATATGNPRYFEKLGVANHGSSKLPSATAIVSGITALL